MANSWLRLWHELPNDPKWRTIARASGQPISSIIAVYIHLLVSASQNDPRGQIDVCPEDLGSALDIGTEAVEKILDAMQGKVLDGAGVKGWDKRQPVKEDNSAERVARFRKRHSALRNDESVFVTPTTPSYSPF